MGKQKENLCINNKQLYSIQKLFKSDIRSMINFLQANHEVLNNTYMGSIITDKLWEDIIINIKENNNINTTVTFIKQNAAKYNLEDKDLIITFISYLVEHKEYAQMRHWIRFFKFIVHRTISFYFNVVGGNLRK